MRHKNSALNIITLAVTIGAVAASQITPEWMIRAVPWLLFISIVVLGIPHGAVDHVIASNIYGFRDKWSGHLIFYSSYLFVMFIVGLLWFFFPIAGLILFLLISIYHFGQSDAIAMIEKKSFWFYGFLWLRGITIIAFILFANPQITVPIIESAIRQQPDWFDYIYQYSNHLSISTLIIYVASILPITFSGQLKTTKILFLSDSILFTILFLFAHPLAAFAIYFSLWHSAGHVKEMIQFFEKRERTVTITQFYIMALPFTLVSLFGMIVLFYVYQTFSFKDELIALLFILISVLTLPHMFIVEKMFKTDYS